MYILLFGGCICVMLLVALIASAIRSGESAESASLNALAAEERTELEAALAVFDTIGYPNADIAGEILPAMRLHFHTATTLDSLIVYTVEIRSRYGYRNAIGRNSRNIVEKRFCLLI